MSKVRQSPCPVAKKRKTCSADDRTQPQAAQDKEISVEIDADKVEDLENMPVMQEKEECTVVSIHEHSSHSDEDEHHQVCEVEEALETEINTDDGCTNSCIWHNSNKYKQTRLYPHYCSTQQRPR
eukprot:Em0007g91a